MTYTWLATELRTGRLIAELRDLDVREVTAKLGGVATASGITPLAKLREYERALEPGGSALVLVDDDLPIWGGIAWAMAEENGVTATVSLATWESLGDRRFTGDLTRENVGQSTIAADLSGLLLGDTPLIIETPTGAGAAMTRDYKDAQDKTVLSALTELSGVLDGPEWCITWRHLSSPERYVPVLTIADRIGTAPAVGMAPAATFDYGEHGNVTRYLFTTDYSDGKGATSVIATSSPSAAVRPQSDPQTVTDPDRPRIEKRFTPTTSITETDTLTAHARRALAAMSAGQRTLELSAAVDSAPRLGRQWAMGDTVGYDIVRPYAPRMTGRARVTAWTLSLSGVREITPTLLLEDA